MLSDDQDRTGQDLTYIVLLSEPGPRQCAGLLTDPAPPALRAHREAEGGGRGGRGTLVVLISPQQNIGQAGLADPSRPEDDNTRTRIPGMSSLRGFYRKISYFSQFVTEGSQLLLVLASPRFWPQKDNKRNKRCDNMTVKNVEIFIALLHCIYLYSLHLHVHVL